MHKIFTIAIILPLAACGHSAVYTTAIQEVPQTSRIIQRAPLPRAVMARTAAVHQHGRVDVAYPWWDAADPYQPWKSNYAPNLGEAGNNDGASASASTSSSDSSSNGSAR